MNHPAAARPATPRRHTPLKFILIVFAILAIAAATFGIIRLIDINNRLDCNLTPEHPDCPAAVDPTPEPAEPTTPPFIDLQATVDDWAASLSRGSAGVIIYDLDNDAIAASYDADASFSTESLYKLFVVYEGYRRIANGSIDPDSTISAGRSWATCLDLAIRESNSPCAEAMRSALGIDSLNAIIKNDYNIQHSNIGTLTSTPRDIADLMKLFYEHTEFSDETWAIIQDSMLNQPPVDNGWCSGACDWRRGLPAGFTSGSANVYNKVGWRSASNGVWHSYHDAAIIEFPDLDRHYIVVVMTKNSYLKDIVSLGSAIENAILNYVQN